MSPRVAAVILAAGASTRMGRNKLLLPVDGEAMVHRAARRALAAGLSPVVVVLGHEGDRVRAALGDLGVAFSTSPDPTGPTSASLHAGLRALGPEVTATVVMLSDMVHVTEAMLRAIVESSAHGAAPLEVSRYGDVLAPPLLFTRALWPELLSWHGEGCGKAVVRAHRAEAGLHDWPEQALRDIDTPDDYAGLTP
ncbi:MAG: nucleotidyltransferase family protein [Gemmatimonadetes bacterium]|nr:nucleotidyltransferase family protein [Gemmatimonadota bacterium]